ncbi:MAG: hypothetical protein KBS60_04205 [Phascolarctobacterium sp.]|nr:hypothetical protein [Candidatus Phascolarctobacterium caballi]
MSETLIAAFLSAAVTLTVSLITNHAQSEKSRALIEYQVGELKKQVEKHNNIIERTYKLEELTAVQTEQIKVANHRIEDLEKWKGSTQ